MSKNNRFLFLMITPAIRDGESQEFQDAVESFEDKNDCFFSGCTGEMIIFQRNHVKND